VATEHLDGSKRYMYLVRTVMGSVLGAVVVVVETAARVKLDLRRLSMI
jgi:hypothetical protein